MFLSFTNDYTFKNVEGICVKRIGFILMAIMLIALMAPACMAQSAQTVVNVKGYVYKGALPVDGAKVQIYSWDGEKMGTSPMSTTVSATIDGLSGAFEFKNVPYDPSKTFNWVVQAEKDGAQAHAMVYIVPPQQAGEAPKAEPIVLDLGMWDWKTDLRGMVQSGNLATNALPISDATVKIYARDANGTVGTTPVATAITDASGQFDIPNVLGYGQYQAVAITKDNHVARTNFTAYQQETHVNLVMTDIILATPTPTAKPGGSTSGGFFGLPGFEAVLALAALSGTSLFLRRR
ncbi:hypothetical protein Mtc_0835 [Methanocella conradii HZ254]|uniref:PGF-CTERM archaeal protein-sorting signal domain-containing protein n=2 Tax=Methanocella TaxID=570266 RepID=H8IAC2_METCZ|nr:hypothetical protein Mtc_0835 [Methanocella conradii HZ254]